MSDRSPDAQRALRVYLVAEAASSLLFAVMTTLNLVYQVQVVHLTPLELVLVGTLLEGTCLLAEVPTGVLADIRSRRLSVVIGFVLIGLGFTLEGAVPQLWAVLAAQFVWGVGATFTSGAFEAWLVDEAGEEAAGRTFLRAAQVANAGALVGIAASVALGAVDVRLPIVMGGL